MLGPRRVLGLLPSALRARVMFFSERVPPPPPGPRATPSASQGAARQAPRQAPRSSSPRAPSRAPSASAGGGDAAASSSSAARGASAEGAGRAAGGGGGGSSAAAEGAVRSGAGAGSGSGSSGMGGPLFWSSVADAKQRLERGFTPLAEKPRIPATLPPGLLTAEHLKARTGDPVAVQSALGANPYGWRDEARAARQAPLWMLYEEGRAGTAVGKRPEREQRSFRRLRKIIAHRERDAAGRAYATGGRKTASARVWVGEGDGLFTVNRRPLQLYFPRIGHRLTAMEPLTATQAVGAFNVDVSVRGGGLSGQAGAVRQGLAKALVAFDPTLKPVVRALGMLVRDPRMVERKKPGQRKARAKFQWVRR